MTARLDLALVARGLVRSRSAAQHAILDGRVQVDGVVVRRPAAPAGDHADLAVEATGRISRAAQKLEAALDAFAVPVSGRLALDLGASTGGFTALLLGRGARRVLAVDVGHDQLVAELRSDPRVVVVEGLNARFLAPEVLRSRTGVTEAPTLVVADLSFISLTRVLPAAVSVAAPSADFVVLIKPQFEVGRGGVRDGVVRDPAARRRAVTAVLAAARDGGLGVAGVLRSPVLGASGNVEVLAHLTGASDAGPTEWTEQIQVATAAPEKRTGAP